MLGCRGGVSKLLKDSVPYLISNHCVAHRLALACGQAANEIPYLKKFKSILDQLYRFYQNSAVRMASLKSIQEVVNDPQHKPRMLGGFLMKRQSATLENAYHQC